MLKCTNTKSSVNVIYRTSDILNCIKSIKKELFQISKNFQQAKKYKLPVENIRLLL